MKQFKFSTLSFFILLSMLIAVNAFAGKKGLPGEWTEVNPEGFIFKGLTPSCSGAPGTPDDEFTFFVKGGEKKNIVVFFQGGGACWDLMNCIVAPTYSQHQFEELFMFTDDNKGMGIFDQTEEDNPFKDWGFVYIPYCTGDLFWGANDVTYGENVIKHRGFVNFQAVLKYLKKNTHKPNKIFVTGSSAGSYGATMAFPFIEQAFPHSKTYLLGDAGNGVMGGSFPTEGIYNWNVQTPNWIFPGGYDPSMTMDVIYTGIAAEYPNSPIAQYTTAFDSTQIFFYNVMLNIDNPGVWYNPDKLFEAGLVWYPTSLGYLYNAAMNSPNYRYYIAAGGDHTILQNPALLNKFFTENSAGGVRLVDWINDMINNPWGDDSSWENLE